MIESPLPPLEQIDALPRWAKVAFAARCARHALSLFLAKPSTFPPERASVAEHAIRAVEEYAAESHDAHYRHNAEIQAAVAAEVEARTAREAALTDFEDAESALRRVELAAKDKNSKDKNTKVTSGPYFNAVQKARERYLSLDSVLEIAVRETVRAKAQLTPAHLAQFVVEVNAIVSELHRTASERAALAQKREAAALRSASAATRAFQLRGAAEATALAETHARAAHAARAVERAVRTALGEGTVRTVLEAAEGAGVPVQTICADFRTLSLTAVRDGWTDTTSVSPSVFEPSEPAAFAPWADRLAAIRADESRATDTARQEADDAMRKQYSGEYVAYSEDGATARRTILAHDPSLAVVREALAHLSEEVVSTIKVAYCDPPASAFRGGYDGRWPAGAPAESPAE